MSTEELSLLESVLDALEMHGATSAHVRLGPLDLEVSLSGAPARLAPAVPDDDDGDTDDDLAEQDPRFALERLNAGRGKAR